MTVDAGLVAADFMLRHGAIKDETGAIGAAISISGARPSGA
jgi:hypothetical protein